MPTYLHSMPAYHIDFFSRMSATWIIQDMIIYVLSIAVLFFIMKRDPENAPYRFMEIVLMVGLFGGIYENYAVEPAHFYSFGTSLIMLGNVPLSVPLVEAVMVVCALYIMDHMEISAWCKPFVVGFLVIVQDFSLDPLSVSQVAETSAGVSGRWQWLIVQPGDASLFGEPVFNFTGWMLIGAYSTIGLLLGRWWFERSGRKPWVGVLYPVAGITGAVVLMLLFPWASQFLLWAAPFYEQGSSAEWVMLAVNLLVPVGMLLFAWRGRMKKAIVPSETWLFFGYFLLLHVSDVVFMVIGQHWNTAGVVLGSFAVHLVVFGTIYAKGRQFAGQFAGGNAAALRTA